MPALVEAAIRFTRPARQPTFRCPASANGIWPSISEQSRDVAGSELIVTRNRFISTPASPATGIGAAAAAESDINLLFLLNIIVKSKKFRFIRTFLQENEICRLRYSKPLTIRRPHNGCALRLSVRTPDFHSGKRGSTPLGRTTSISP